LNVPAECDGDGFFRITGRLARFAKLFGKRVNLADVEEQAEQFAAQRVGVVDGGDHLRAWDCQRAWAVIEAAGELSRRGRVDIKLVFIGDGREKDRLQRRAKQDGLTN